MCVGTPCSLQLLQVDKLLVLSINFASGWWERLSMHHKNLRLTLLQADNLRGSDRTTHPFARLMLAGEVLHTSVMWQTTHPTWEEKIVFKCAPDPVSDAGSCKIHEYAVSWIGAPLQ